eukprot:TRINITY_DN34640_c0_g1_i1.p1 TRINITY_DN34640_c0_g1~~TRINITY_DN34640_c0_g1_i1.p1  ORF type:complete len:346 (-),score=70.32 TRINITY_DN34640_c0_g1_i1:791-1828(-)
MAAGAGGADELVLQFLEAHARSPLPCLDLRSEEQVHKHWLVHCTHIPWEQLQFRSYELPPRETTLALILFDSNTEADENTEDANMLGGPRLADVLKFFQDCKKPWRLQLVLESNAAFWQAAAQRGLVRSGPLPRPFIAAGPQSMLEKSEDAAASLPVLWRPSPLLQQWLPEALQRAPGRVALDVGSGSGRDTIFAAMHGWQVTAVDNMPKALERVRSFAANMRVADSVATSVVDLKSDEDAARLFADMGPLSLVIVIRFLHKPLLPALADAIAPGGLVIYEHFAEGCRDHPLGRPSKVDDLVLPGELQAAFGGPAWEVLLDGEGREASDGRPMAHFVAVKKQVVR